VVAHLFDDIPVEGNAHWAVGVLLSAFGDHEAALAESQLGALECANSIGHSKALDLVAQSLWYLERHDEAYKSISKCLLIPDITPQAQLEALITRARIEVALGEVDKAAASYKAARLADPRTPVPGKMLHEEFTLYSGKCSDADLVDIVKQWQPLERLTWMTWGYRGYNIYSDHHRLQEAAARCNEVPFLVMAYEEAIRFLDQMDSGAPMRRELSMLHYRVRGDLDAAKEILDGILDSKTDGNLYALTNDDPESTLIHAFNFLLDIIYEQFRSTGDRERKAQLLMEVRNLRQRPLVQSIPLGESLLMHQTITLARMIHKMGPVTEFHDLLDRVFFLSYETLLDNAAWNDYSGLSSIIKILSSLEGLEQEMCILFSAQFSALDFLVGDPRHSVWSEGSTETSPHNENNSAKVEEPTEEGHLVWTCDGECNISFTQWAGRSMYKCVTCADIGLCESCFQKRQEYNEDLTRKAGRKYCGVKHKYIKGPIEGWKGISKGVMRIQGSEPVLFKDWLADLKDKKWKEAWDRFWKSD
jgi:tetratricopeptide (TPR) repeat protein